MALMRKSLINFLSRLLYMANCGILIFLSLVSSPFIIFMRFSCLSCAASYALFMSVLKDSLSWFWTFSSYLCFRWSWSSDCSSFWSTEPSNFNVSRTFLPFFAFYVVDSAFYLCSSGDLAFSASAAWFSEVVFFWVFRLFFSFLFLSI